MIDSFKQLQQLHPWPDVSGLSAHNFTLGGGGREVIEREIEKIRRTKHGTEPIFMVEIGCFMCASTRRWLAKFDTLHIVGVDPWPESLKEQVKKYVDRPLLNRLYPHAEDQTRFVEDIRNQGPKETGLANIQAYQDRFIPVQGYSPDALKGIADTGFVPDLVYIDGAKQPEDLEGCYEHWPTAKITGDDWHWGRNYGYPMRKIVKKFALKNDFGIEANWATWVLHKDQDSSLLIQAAHRSDLFKLQALATRCHKNIDFEEKLGRLLVIYDETNLIAAGSVAHSSIEMTLIDPLFESRAAPLLLTALHATIQS
ncbi:hypothetical protein QGN29_06220 [Temperatibacter marinus]|uniref:Uncharacterized protein n=1 Tax=Temperatibacter marinus TaxID=1456591 RepID=A0AA52HBT2_9PROT|nr:class I SAM-dependent methyltransferase [Temperatibacter marinus]WND03968.1 hypothetical protein QGN29_06220 [Temperatibacter marinus]